MVDLTESQKQELEIIGELYRRTIYDSSLKTLPEIVKAFADGLDQIHGEISASIVNEVIRFHKLITSNHGPQMQNRIDGLYDYLSKHLNEDEEFQKYDEDIEFSIICRQKSWESVLRKILKYYFNKQSLILPDLVALRVVIDADLSEPELEIICHKVSNLCISYFTKEASCELLHPSKMVAGNALLKDYICNPRGGYKSIHLAFMDIAYNDFFEVQIRSVLMDVNAEHGPEIASSDTQVLAHRKYKEEEYSCLTPYIYFEPEKASRPHFRTYMRKGKLIVSDKIGLKYARPMEYRYKTY